MPRKAGTKKVHRTPTTVLLHTPSDRDLTAAQGMKMSFPPMLPVILQLEGGLPLWVPLSAPPPARVPTVLTR